MPLYEYQCIECGSINSELHGMNETCDRCSQCGSLNIHRLISIPALGKVMENRMPDGSRFEKGHSISMNHLNAITKRKFKKSDEAKYECGEL